MKILVAIITLFFSLIAFLPKANMLFSAEQYLKSEKVFFNIQKIDEYPFSLELKKVGIIYNGIEAVKIQNVSSFLTLFYNSVKFKNINIDFNNLKINSLSIAQNVLHPFMINVKGIANFGKIEGKVNLKTRKVLVYILNLKDNNLKSFLKHNKKGYFYETTF